MPSITVLDKLLPKVGTPIDEFKGCLEAQGLRYKEYPPLEIEGRLCGTRRKKWYSPPCTSDGLQIGRVDFWFIDGKYDGWGYAFDPKVASKGGAKYPKKGKQSKAVKYT